MAAPTAGSFLLTSNYDTLQNQVTNIENAGVNSTTSSVSGTGTVTSTSYTSTLSGSTVPSVTVTLAAGQNVMIGVFAGTSNNTASDGGYISFAVSGTATEAATDARGAHNTNSTAINNGFTVGRVTLYTAGSAGSYTFTMNARAVTGGTFSTANRTIWAVLLPYNS